MLKKLFQFLGRNKAILLIFALSLFARGLWLDLFPVSMVHDELNYVMNAKSLFYTGKNIPLTASSLFSWGEKDWDVVISEIPSYFIAPWIGPNKLNQFNVRIPYALVSSLSVVFLYLITKRLLNGSIATFSALVMALNPWSVHFGRTALEVNFAILFFLIGIYLFVANKSWKIFWAYPFFVLGFMSYLGAKLHFFPLILILICFKIFLEKIKNRRPIIIFGLISLITLLLYIFSMKFQPAGARRGELILFDTKWASSIVDVERRQGIPNIARDIFSNKASVILKRIAEVYISGFSSTQLFVKGDVVSVYSLWQHGQFYYLDFILILLGLVVLFSLNKKVFWLVVALVLVGPTVSSIDLLEQTYPVRSFPMFPFLCLLAGVGFWYVKEKIWHGKYVFTLLFVVYLALVANFLNLYFYKYPVYSAERWSLSERILGKYVSLLKNNPDVKKIYAVVGENPKIVFEHYLFYGGGYDSREDVVKANENLKKKDFSDGKVTFIKDCPDMIDFEGGDILISDARAGCLKEEKGFRGIVSLADAGTIFVIKNDRLCQDINLARYYTPQSFNDFRIEEMGREEFCRKWIISF